MYLGKSVSFSRSGTTITITTSTDEVGAIHFSQSGYSSINVTGGTVNKNYDLEDGFNLLAFPNEAVGSLSLTFTGTGTVDWTTLALYETDIDLTSEKLRHRPAGYNPNFSVFDGNGFGVSDVLVAELRFDWRHLDWGKVDELEGLFDSGGAFVLIPDGFEGERYNVVITSPFDFYPSVDSNFASGASGALVFSTV